MCSTDGLPAKPLAVASVTQVTFEGHICIVWRELSPFPTALVQRGVVEVGRGAVSPGCSRWESKAHRGCAKKNPIYFILLTQ